MFHAAPDQSRPLCPDCRSELLEQSKEFLVDMLGHVTGVNLLTMAAAATRTISWKEPAWWILPSEKVSVAAQ